jgi:thiol-disulfide isomerase/thioredoxin
MLAGFPPEGMHCIYDSSQEFLTSAKDKDPAKDYLKRGRRDEKVRRIVVETRDDGKQVHLLLTTDIKRRVFEFQRGGKEDEDLRKKHEKVYSTMRAAPELLGPEGEASGFWVSHLPKGLPNYLLEKLRALPTKPVALGETWQSDITGDDYSGHAAAKLVRVEHVEGRMIATIEGSYEATWNLKIPEEGNVTITYKVEDYVRKLDVATHTTNRESYTLNMGFQYESGETVITSKTTTSLLNREVVENEKWQPDMGNFANALLELRSGGEEKINKHMFYMQKISDFAKKNPDTVCGKKAQTIIDEQQFLGKNIFDFITLENCEDWLNGPVLRNEDIRGKVFLIEFWSTTCDGCVMVTPMLAKLYREFSPRGFVIVGVTPEQGKEREEIVAHLKKHNIAYPNLWDKNRILDKALNVEYLPFGLLINRQGVVVWEGSPDPSDEKAFRKAIQNLLKQGEN